MTDLGDELHIDRLRRKLAMGDAGYAESYNWQDCDVLLRAADQYRADLAAAKERIARLEGALRKIADAREFVCDGVSAGCCYGYATKRIAEKTLMAALAPTPNTAGPQEAT
jgi:hypothetical protein